MWGWLKGSGAAEAPAVTPQGQQAPTALFRYLPSRAGGDWEEVASNATLELFDANEDSNKKAPEWHLEVDGAQDPIDTLVDDQFSFDAKDKRVTFLAGDDVWSLKFGSAGGFERFLQKYNKASFENRFGQEQTDASEAKLFGDFAGALNGVETDESRQHWAEDMDCDKPDARELKTPAKDRMVAEKMSPIHGVVMGATDRSYLMRDNQIDVLKNVQGGIEDLGLSFKLTPPPAAAGLGGGSTPTMTPPKALLMNQERRMNMISPLSGASLWHADIETGKVISEWKFQKDGVDVSMKDITTENKAAQTEDTNVFLGLDTNRLARWDMRDPHGLVSQAASPSVITYAGGKDYARGTKFSCMATSGDGYVVVGADDGKVRLYSEKTLTQAKTSIPGMGLPITEVDVTYDGKWALATTRNYLMVLKTTYKDPKSGKELCGFTNRMGSNAPAPRLLRLKPEDVKLTKNAPLEKGHFTWITEQGRQERWIVASCGNYTVLWNFRSVKVADPEVVSYGGLTTVTNYHLVKKDEHVVDSVFMHDNFRRAAGGADDMVVVTKTHVYAVGDEDSDFE
ncbi:vacuolar import Vid27-related [Micractinium conductrix]|uniref:Vacuolar import Vid27-related n=1 Tax=Micractinium conductrix TaxID=554055 RepID=A0A2P6V1G3_9CHLO|nr:vacuolar import Vid27-related [Micractinium conductrix]|eukprot:PSC67936.1 vacuolar import Vid27-related [Micractinium conductrix]